MARASRVACGVTKGLPSRSPPIHEPKEMSWGRSARDPTLSDEAGEDGALDGSGSGNSVARARATSA